MGASVEDELGAGRPPAGGPSTWLVLLVTAVAAVAVIAGIIGYRAWRGDGDEPAAAAPGSAAPSTSLDAGDDPAGRLFTRVTDGDIEIRVDRVDGEAMGIDFGMSNRDGAPGFCTVVDQAMATAISADGVAQAWLPITQDASPDPAPVMLGTMFGMGPGLGGGDGLLGLVVQLADDAVSARLTTPTAVDEMAPIDGVAALAVTTAGAAGDAPAGTAGAPFRPGGAPLDDITLTVLHRDGCVRQARGDDLVMGPLVWRGIGECFEAFEPGPATTVSEEDNPFAVDLPPPGEQPPDPDAARAAIDAAMTALYGAGDDVDVLALVDDPFAMRETFARLDSGVVGFDWDDVEVVVEELVFLSPVEAAFEYTLAVPDADLTRDEQFGRARLVDGTWRIGRGTICRDLQETFATPCPP